MGCYVCKCNFCARNCELYPGYFTPGEIADVSEICYTCDECKQYDGDPRKGNMWRQECDGYREPRKRTEAKAKIADARARAMRRQIRVIKGGLK